MATDIVWQPDPNLAQASNLAGFMRHMGIKSPDPDGYAQLLALAEREQERFWDEVLKFTNIRFYKPYDKVLDLSAGPEFPDWCVGGTTNAVLNCLDRHSWLNDPSRDGVVWEGEDGQKRRWSYAELNAETSRIAEGLRSLGCGPGDVIGVLMPMVPEAVAGLLAIPKIGAIALPLFSGFGPQAIIDRMNDGGAVAILTADGAWRRAKSYELKSTVDKAAAEIPTLKHVVVLRNIDKDIPWQEGRDHWWHELCEGQATDAPTTEMPAEAPMMLIYTSGTTGKPKGAVHSHCGFMAKLALDMGLCADFREGDRMMWMSDIGWLAGPMLVYGSTLIGATIVIAEGAQDYPDKGRYWRLIEENRVSFLGIAPTIIRGFMQEGGAGIENYDLSSLRVSLSTGEAWNLPAWNWMFEKVCARRVPIINYSGGTEIGGGIVTGTVIHPMKPTAFSGPVPGMGADIVDEQGNSVPAPGVGELVLRQPSIGLTRSLWKDDERFLDSYWRTIPGLWCQGDRARIDEDGYWYILGRSDDTLKIAGKRTGPSEIETLVMQTGRVAEVAAIGVPDEIKGQSVLLVVVPMPDEVPDAQLEKALSDAVVGGLGGAFRPSSVVFVEDIPKTRNMKIMRRVVKAAYQGQAPGDLSSLVNPEAVEALARLFGTRAAAGQ